MNGLSIALLHSLMQLPGQAVDEAAALGTLQVTAGRQAETTFDAMGFVTVVDRDAIETSTPQVVSDLLQGQPGVHVQQTTPGQGIPIVRGLKGSEVLHLVDGMRLNNAFFRNAPNQYLALFDPNWLEQIEVVRGPASTLYGADAMGGVVHFVTREARYASNGFSTQSDLALRLSSADESGWLSGSFEAASDRQAVLLQAGYQDVGERRTAADGRIDNSEYEARSFRSRWQMLINDESDLMVDIQYLRQPSTPRVDQLIPGFGQEQADATEFFFEPNQRVFAHARYHQTNLPFADDAEWHLSWQEITDDRRSLDTGATNRRLEQNQSSLWQVSAQFANFWTYSDLVYGFDASRDTIDSSRIEQNVLDGSTQIVSARFPDGSTQEHQALFVEYHMRPWERHDFRVGARYTNIQIDLSDAGREIGASLNLDDTTLNAGYRYQISPEIALVANIAEGFRSPNIFDLSALGPRPGNRFNIANPNLTPEQLISYDIGLKWLSHQLEGELVYFQAEFDDKIASVNTGNLTDNDRIIVQSDNLNSQQNTGLEFSWRYLPETPIEWSGTINWIRGEERDADGSVEPADRIPPFSGRVAADWTWTDNTRFRAWADLARRQDRLSSRDASDSRINPNGTAGYAVFNVQANHQLTPQWQFQLGLHNLFDKAYRQHGSGIDAPGRYANLQLRGQF